MTTKRCEDHEAAMGDLTMIGQFFHSFDVKWQGRVVAMPTSGWYLIELFDWLAGDATHRRLVRLEDMAGWIFYQSVEDMRFSYKHGAAIAAQRRAVGKASP